MFKIKKNLLMGLLLYLFCSIGFSHHANADNLFLLKTVPAKMFGQTDSEDQMNTPMGIAIKNGIAYVTDVGNVRIYKVRLSDMQYIGEIKIKNKFGIRAKFMLGRLAFDNNGKLWVTDIENGRVLRISENTGKIKFKFGSLGSGNGQFQAPNGIAIDSSNNIWVADELNSRVQKFNINGTYLSQFSTGVNSFPQDLVFKNGSLYVCVTFYNSIVKYNINTNQPIQYFGGLGILTTPRGLDVNASGEIAVGDFGNQRSVTFKADGTIQNQFPIYFDTPSGVRFYENDIIQVKPLFHQIARYKKDGTLVGTAGKPRNLAFQLNYPNSGSMKKGKIALADGYNHRVQIYNSVGKHKKTVNGFYFPNDVIYAKDGKIYVADYDTTLLKGRIHVLDKKWNKLKTISFPYVFPYKMTMDKNNNLYFTDRVMDAVYKISVGDNPAILKVYSTIDNNNDLKSGIGYNKKTNQIYVTDSYLSHILVFDENLNLVKTMGQFGFGNGDFFMPADVSFNKNATRMYVADAGNFRVQIFDGNGNFKDSIGQLGLNNYHFFGVVMARYFHNNKLLVNNVYLNNCRLYKTSKGRWKGKRWAIKRNRAKLKALMKHVKEERRKIKKFLKTNPTKAKNLIKKRIFRDIY